MVSEDHPELDELAILNDKGIREYQLMMGCLQWLVTLGHINIAFAVACMGCSM